MSDHNPGNWPQPPAPYAPQYVGTTGRHTNTLAIIALVAAFVLSPAAVIMGHLAMTQIKRTGEDGRQLAIAALVIGYVGVFLGVLALIFIVVLTVADIQRYSSSNGYAS